MKKLISFLCLWSALAQGAPAAVDVDRIVALVGDEVITQNELTARLRIAQRQLAKQGTTLPPTEILEAQVLDRLIMDKVQWQQAKETGLTVTDQQLEQGLDRIIASSKMTRDQFQKALERDGVDYPEFREEIRTEILLSRLREREVDSRIVISDAEVNNYLANQGADDNTEYRLAHIFLRAPESASPEDLQKQNVQAEEIVDRAKKGDDFSSLVATFSNAKDALSGGELGMQTKNRLPPLYADLASSMAVGDISEVLRSPAGFHIIKLIQKRGSDEPITIQQTEARHILVRINEVVSENEARRKLETVRERIVHGADFGEQAKLYSQDGSAANGGNLGWINPGDTVPEFENVMNALKTGEISAITKSPFGMHLIQVIQRRDRDVSVERQRGLARQSLRERRLDEAYQEWLRQLRDRTFVEIRLKDE